MQRVLHVESNKSVLKLTTAHYWRPSNKNIDRRKDAKDTDEWGVMPDAGFAVPMDDKQTEAMLKERSERGRRPPRPATGNSRQNPAAGRRDEDRPAIETGRRVLRKEAGLVTRLRLHVRH